MPKPWRAAAAGLALLGALTVAGGAAPLAPPPPGSLPAGCGPRRATEPAPGAIPAAPLSSAPLPIEGAWIQSLAAGPGGMLASLAGNPALYRMAESGGSAGTQAPGAPPSWQPFAAPPGLAGALDPLAATPDGTIAGSGETANDESELWARSPAGSWTAAPLPMTSVLAIAADPATGRLYTAAYSPGPPSGGLLFEGTAASPLAERWPLGPDTPAGAAIALFGGAAVVALTTQTGYVALERAAPGHAPVPFTPAAPAAAAGPVLSLLAAANGSLYLLAGNGLWRLPAGGSAWAPVPEPPSQGQAYALAAAGGDLYLTTGPADASLADALWRAHMGAGSGAVRSWTRLSVPGGGRIAPLAASAGTVWAGTSAGPVAVGPSGGPSLRPAGLPVQITGVASAAWRPTAVAALGFGTIFTSLDGGRSWSLAAPLPTTFGDLADLAWTEDGACLVAGVGGADAYGLAPVYLSGNGGATWTGWPAAPDDMTAAPIEWPVGSGVWWVVARGPGGSGNALYRWGSGAAGWQAVALPDPVETPEHVAGASNGRLWLADEDGRLWLVSFPPQTLLQRLGLRPAPRARAAPEPGAGDAAPWVASDPNDLDVAYAGSRRTTDGGRTWTSVPLPPNEAWSLPAGAVAFAPGLPGAAIAEGANLLRDAGAAVRTLWTDPSPLSPALGGPGVSIAAAGGNRFYVAAPGAGLIVVGDPSPAWQPPAPFAAGSWTPLPAPAAGEAGTEIAEASAPSAPARVYAVDLYGDVLASTDGGLTFARAGSAAIGGQGCCAPPAYGAGPTVVPAALAVSASDPQILYLGLTLNAATSLHPRLGLWTSADGGRTWSATGLPRNSTVLSVAAAPGALYAVVEYPDAGPGGQLYRSTDGGARWRLDAAAPEPLYSVAAAASGAVLAGGEGAVWRSASGTAPFEALPLDLPEWAAGPFGSEAVQAVAETAAGAIWAGGVPGLAVLAPGGAWQVAADAIGNPQVLAGGLQPAPDGGLLVIAATGSYVLRPAAG